MVEQGTLPLQICMAGLALQREAGGYVIDNDRCIIIVLVAVNTRRLEWGEGPVCIVCMATDTGDLTMSAGEWEVGSGVYANPLHLLEQRGVMAIDTCF